MILIQAFKQITASSLEMTQLRSSSAQVKLLRRINLKVLSPFQMGQANHRVIGKVIKGSLFQIHNKSGQQRKEPEQQGKYPRTVQNLWIHQIWSPQHKSDKTRIKIKIVAPLRKPVNTKSKDKLIKMVKTKMFQKSRRRKIFIQTKLK